MDWERIFIETRKGTEVFIIVPEVMKKGKEGKREARVLRVRKRLTDILPFFQTYLGCLAVFSLILQLEVAVQSHYGDTA